jgi:hypothetical protein
VFDVVRTDYGAFYSAKRQMADGQQWHRVNQFILPFHTMITTGPNISFRSFVPLDDYHAMLITQSANPEAAIPEDARHQMAEAFEEVGGYIARTHEPGSYFMTQANKRNDYMLNREVQKDIMYNGIPFVMNLQDRAMTELMCDAAGNPLYDRTQEHLGTSDVYVIAVRRQLLTAAKRLKEEGVVPKNVTDPAIGRVRMGAFVLDKDADWQRETADALNPDAGLPVACDMPLIVE